MKKFEITKEQILELSQYYYSQSNLEMALKEWFPQAFESELKVGRWYNAKNGCLFFLKEITNDWFKGYGFTSSKNYYLDFQEYKTTQLTLATDKEVETALIEEAKRRYNFTKEMIWEFNGVNYRLSYPQFSNFNLSENELFFGGGILFSDGKWAEIINEPLTLTVDEIAEKFGTTADKIKICK